MSFIYTPDDEQRVHAPGAIALICSPYQTHESGLPEWVKNSADAYARADAPPEDRVIVILTCDEAAHGAPSIACLDFVGTTSTEIEKYFRHWADPEAAKQGTKHRTQGGHGNGGKCYMTQMFREYATFHTVRDGRGSRYGIESGTTQFGYVPDSATGRNYSVADMKKELNGALAPVAATVAKLPSAARSVLKGGRGWTLVRGVHPKYYEGSIPIRELFNQARDHAQMLTSLQYASVFVFHNGKAVRGASPLLPSSIEPIKGATEHAVEIPETLIDPAGGRSHSTTDDGTRPPGTLTLRTSRTSMRWSKKTRHTINYSTSDSGFIGYRSMLDFPVESGYRDKIYGDCELDALEGFKQNSRGNLAEAPLTRAVDHFIAQTIQLFAETFEERDKTAYTKKERNALSQMNEALNRWKNRFISDLLVGDFGGGSGSRSNNRLPTGVPSKIELAVTHPRLGIGVAIRPRVRFFDSSGRQIRPSPYRWVSDDPNVAYVDDALMLINSYASGNTVVWAETIDGGLESNRVPIEVIRIRSIVLEPAILSLAAGSRSRLRAVCTMSNGDVFDDVALVWTEQNATIARVSSSGLVFGINAGSTEVIAGDDKVTCDEPARVDVVKSDGDSGTDGRKKGRGYPTILVSGDVDEDPSTGEYVHFSADNPPVVQRPQDADRNIWWINSEAPLAKLYLSKDANFGYESQAWRMYHLERYIEVIAQILVRYDPQIDGPMTKDEFFLMVADKMPELQTRVVDELSEFIIEGAAPEGVA